MAKGFILSESDRDALRQMYDDFRHLLGSQPGSRTRGLYEQDSDQAPEVYVVLTPDTGIAKLTESTDTGTSYGAGDMVASADCTIYWINEEDEAEATAAGTVTVYNLSTTAIAGRRWILAVRDKFGAYIAVNTNPMATIVSSGGGSGLTSVSGREVDGSPDVATTLGFEFDQADGLRVSSGAGGRVRVDIAPASATDTGVVNTTTQSFAGAKTFTGNVVTNGPFSLTARSFSSTTESGHVFFETSLSTYCSEVFGTRSGTAGDVWMRASLSGISTDGVYVRTDQASTRIVFGGPTAYPGLSLYDGSTHRNGQATTKLGMTFTSGLLTSTATTGISSTEAGISFTDGVAVSGSFSPWVSAPASASATGTQGQMAFDSDYFYICTATNTWKRVAIATW